MHFQSSIKDLRDRSKKMSKHILQENYERFFGKREFGDPLPTFKGVMEKHQVNKLNEDWWDNMSPEDKAEYIKAHPGSNKAQASKEEPKEKPSGVPDPMDQMYQDYQDTVGMSPGASSSALDKKNQGASKPEPEAEPYSGKGQSLASQYRDDYKEKDEKRDVASSEMITAREEYKAAQEKVDKGGLFGKKKAKAKLDAAKKDFEEKTEAFRSAKTEASDAYKEQKDALVSGEVEPENEQEAAILVSAISKMADAADRDMRNARQASQYDQQHPDPRMADLGIDNDKYHRDNIVQKKAAKKSADTKLTVAHEKAKELKGVGKDWITGKQESIKKILTIDGKQFRRISEGVEKEPKPKYEFSEFYKRFKK